ncbi:MAG: AsnC family transcriptional regulator [Thermodesulfobacteriota bacterium]
MDIINKEILNAIQKGFPLVRSPFAKLGRKFDLSEAETLARIKDLKGEGVLRQINAIFDSRKLGFVSTLVAVKLAQHKLDKAGLIISSHPGVSHNYTRNHSYNLWFTITLPAETKLEETVKALAEQAQAKNYLLLPALRTFKIGVMLDMVNGSKPDRKSLPKRKSDKGMIMAVKDRELIAALEEDLPLVPRPYQELAKRSAMSETGLLAGAKKLLDQGAMRRFAGVLNHRQAGFTFNAMAAWRVPKTRLKRVGELMASFSAVTHCYQRPTFPDWPYNIFTMVHGRNQEECTSVVSAIAEATQIKDYRLLYSIKEYKKVRVKYARMM